MGTAISSNMIYLNFGCRGYRFNCVRSYILANEKIFNWSISYMKTDLAKKDKTSYHTHNKSLTIRILLSLTSQIHQRCCLSFSAAQNRHHHNIDLFFNVCSTTPEPATSRQMGSVKPLSNLVTRSQLPHIHSAFSGRSWLLQRVSLHCVSTANPFASVV
jgi:hypothetical protein